MTSSGWSAKPRPQVGQGSSAQNVRQSGPNEKEKSQHFFNPQGLIHDFGIFEKHDCQSRVLAAAALQKPSLQGIMNIGATGHSLRTFEEFAVAAQVDGSQKQVRDAYGKFDADYHQLVADSEATIKGLQVDLARDEDRLTALKLEKDEEALNKAKCDAELESLKAKLLAIQEADKKIKIESPMQVAAQRGKKALVIARASPLRPPDASDESGSGTDGETPSEKSLNESLKELERKQQAATASIRQINAQIYGIECSISKLNASISDAKKGVYKDKEKLKSSCFEQKVVPDSLNEYFSEQYDKLARDLTTTIMHLLESGVASMVMLRAEQDAGGNVSWAEICDAGKGLKALLKMMETVSRAGTVHSSIGLTIELAKVPMCDSSAAAAKAVADRAILFSRCYCLDVTPPHVQLKDAYMIYEKMFGKDPYFRTQSVRFQDLPNERVTDQDVADFLAMCRDLKPERPARTDADRSRSETKLETGNAAVAAQLSHAKPLPKHGGCFNCGGAHPVSGCNQKRDEAKIAKNLAEYRARLNANQKKTEEKIADGVKPSSSQRKAPVSINSICVNSFAMLCDEHSDDEGQEPGLAKFSLSAQQALAGGPAYQKQRVHAVIDSGAQKAAANRGLATNIRKEINHVRLADGSKLTTTEVGTLSINLESPDGKQFAVNVEDVLLDDSFPLPLFSLRQFTRNGIEMHCTSDGNELNFAKVGGPRILLTEGFGVWGTPLCEEAQAFCTANAPFTGAVAAVRVQTRGNGSERGGRGGRGGRGRAPRVVHVSTAPPVSIPEPQMTSSPSCEERLMRLEEAMQNVAASLARLADQGNGPARV